LRVEQVDLHGGHIDILQAKGCRSRRLPLSDELLHLLKVYDEAVAAIYPRRIYFFPRNRSTCYSPCQLDSIFRSVWKAAGLEVQEGKRARLYDVRHHFAFANLNRWIAAGKDPNVLLPYLSRYMGHAGMESTDYYLHLVPAFFHTFRDEVKSTETLLPEPDYE
jgi:integrase